MAVRRAYVREGDNQTAVRLSVEGEQPGQPGRAEQESVIQVGILAQIVGLLGRGR